MRQGLIFVALALMAGHVFAQSSAPAEPDPTSTPGATNLAVTQQTIWLTICVRGWTATVRPPARYTGALKRRQIARLGYGDTDSRDYEEDHLIPLELGGNPSDPRNLWPEPRYGTAWNARTKDRLENYLRRAVCDGEVSLGEARREIATDWVAAYRRYLGEPVERQSHRRRHRDGW